MAKIGINMTSGSLQQSEIVVGIDLGTTNSLVAYVNTETHEPIAINDMDKGEIIPSVVHFTDLGQILVGNEALEMLVHKPENTIYSVKRLLGKSYKDISSHAHFFGYKIIDNDDDSLVKVRVGDKFYTPIELSALILRELKLRAEHALKTPVNRAVITVPAYFNDSQRQATRDAGKLAGLEVLRIINEPTAASLAYGIGLKANEEKTIAVYDLGGGTFDVSILHLQNGIFEVLSTNGDTWLGGDDFDQAIMNYWMVEHHLTASEMNADKNLSQQMRLTAEQAKRSLSCELKYEQDGFKINKEKFNELIKPIVDRTIVCCKKALADANLSVEDIDEVLLVGGSTRVPLVIETVKQFFKRIPQNNIDPDQVVALGAAIQADVLAGNRKDVLLLDVTPLSLGIETMGGIMDVIVSRNSKIPTKAGRQYTTQKDGQVNMKISVYQGERDLVQYNRKLAEFELKNIPAMPAGLPKVDVNFILNADGILKVEAIELRSQIKQTIEVKPQYGLTDVQVENMLLDSIKNAESDISSRALAEAKTAAQQLLYYADKFMEKHAHLLSEEEVKNTQEHLSLLKNALSGDDKNLILKQMDDLDDYTKPLAERIMDYSIAEAMKGKKII